MVYFTRNRDADGLSLLAELNSADDTSISTTELQNDIDIRYGNYKVVRITIARKALIHFRF